MNYLHLLCFVSVMMSLIQNGRMETRGPTWGNISGSYLFQERVTKNSIPFFTRSMTVEYPVSDPDAKGKPVVLHLLRGIEHVNLVNKEETGCTDPIVEIKEGGIYYPNVKIDITSPRGCPLDSVVHFFGSK